MQTDNSKNHHSALGEMGRVKSKSRPAAGIE